MTLVVKFSIITMVKYNAYRHDFILTASICIPIACIAVILRFIARYNRRQKYHAEEWFAVAALITFLVYSSLCLYGKLNYPNRNSDF